VVEPTVVNTVSNITVSTENFSLASAEERYFSSSQENRYPSEKRRINIWMSFFKIDFTI
jgi:hypothetical protein